MLSLSYCKETDATMLLHKDENPTLSETKAPETVHQLPGQRLDEAINMRCFPRDFM